MPTKCKNRNCMKEWRVSREWHSLRFSESTKHREKSCYVKWNEICNSLFALRLNGFQFATLSGRNQKCLQLHQQWPRERQEKTSHYSTHIWSVALGIWKEGAQGQTQHLIRTNMNETNSHIWRAGIWMNAEGNSVRGQRITRGSKGKCVGETSFLLTGFRGNWWAQSR